MQSDVTKTLFITKKEKKLKTAEGKDIQLEPSPIQAAEKQQTTQLQVHLPWEWKNQECHLKPRNLSSFHGDLPLQNLSSMSVHLSMREIPDIVVHFVLLHDHLDADYK